MKLLLAILIGTSSLLLTLFSYVNQLYSEKGRFLIRGSKDNVDFFEDQIEPKLGLAMEKAELTFPFLIQMDIVLLTLLVASWNAGELLAWETLIQTAIFLVLDVVLFALVIPNVILTRTTGKWMLSSLRLLRVAIWLAAVFGLRALRGVNETLASIFTVLFLIYIIYSWTWSRILRRLL